MFNLYESPHRRYNPLTDTWVLVSPQRGKRPWQGSTTPPNVAPKPAYDAQCYLCPGNIRISGVQNPNYQQPYVFPNDFMAILPDTAAASVDEDFFHAQSVAGECRVVCYSPAHNQTMAQLSVDKIAAVIDLWQTQSRELGEHYRWVQIFENKGEMMGCSNPHPHGQIWASDFLPNEVQREDKAQCEYFKKKQSVMLLDYAHKEQNAKTRVIVETDYFVVVVPYWAVWPFETLLLPKLHVRRMQDLSAEQSADLALALKKLTSRYDNLFQVDFPYTMGFHGAPYQQESVDYWQFHAHFYPPLLRSASVKKFMVGYEMLAEVQRDLTPEQAAERLLAVSDVRFSEQG